MTKAGTSYLNGVDTESRPVKGKDEAKERIQTEGINEDQGNERAGMEQVVSEDVRKYRDCVDLWG